MGGPPSCRGGMLRPPEATLLLLPIARAGCEVLLFYLSIQSAVVWNLLLKAPERSRYLKWNFVQDFVRRCSNWSVSHTAENFRHLTIKLYSEFDVKFGGSWEVPFSVPQESVRVGHIHRHTGARATMSFGVCCENWVFEYQTSCDFCGNSGWFCSFGAHFPIVFLWCTWCRC